MPRQNRVTPTVEIVATPERGLWMGNRGGRLHGADGTLGRARWRSKAWIICRLEFKGRQRQIMAPNSYTELFFLDEATAYAAGHRPCFECRRHGFRIFQGLWRKIFNEPCRAPDMDAVLYQARLSDRQVQNASDLPTGAMIVADGAQWLIDGPAMKRWTHAGYGETRPRPTSHVPVLTPAPIIALLKAGLPISLHPNAR